MEELLPDVEDAPILGGHNRNPKPATGEVAHQMQAPLTTPESSMEFESSEMASAPAFLGRPLPAPSNRVRFPENLIEFAWGSGI